MVDVERLHTVIKYTVRDESLVAPHLVQSARVFEFWLIMNTIVKQQHLYCCSGLLSNKQHATEGKCGEPITLLGH